MKKLLALLCAAACGGGGGSDDGTGMVDAPVAPAILTISGTATARSAGGSSPVDAATIAAYAAGNDTTPIAMTTTDASGNFSLVITTTAGQALNGYLKASKSGMVNTYLTTP